MSISRDQVILAADSRTGLFLNGQFIRTLDNGCKAIGLSPTLMFAAAGATRTSGPLPGNVYYDSQELAREAAHNFVFDPEWMSPNETVKAKAEKWAWDVAFRIRRGLRTGAYLPLDVGVTGVFAGLEPNGEIAVAIAKLEYPARRPGLVMPPVTILISILPPPQTFTWIEAVGRWQVANEYLVGKSVTVDKRAEHERIRDEQLASPVAFQPSVVERLMSLTFEKDQLLYPDGSKLVGGVIDTAKLSRKGKVEWLRQKEECSSTPLRN